MCGSILSHDMLLRQISMWSHDMLLQYQVGQGSEHMHGFDTSL